MGYPQSSSIFWIGIFHEINHLVKWGTPIYGNLHLKMIYIPVDENVIFHIYIVFVDLLETNVFLTTQIELHPFTGLKLCSFVPT